MKAEYEDYYRKIGLNIAYYRRLADISQDVLGEKLKIEQTHVSKIENARVGISLDMLFDIAMVLDVEPYKLLQFRD